MLRRIFLVATAFVLFGTVAQSHAQQREFGLGIILGEPTGISAKLWESSTDAWDAALAWSFVNTGHVHIHADRLWHQTDVINTSLNLKTYFGIGGALSFVGEDSDYWKNREGERRRSATILAARVPVGITLATRSNELEFFLEVVPQLNLVPATHFSIGFGVGGRYFF